MRIVYLFLVLLFAACTNSSKKLTAQQIIDKTIEASGTNKVANSKISFVFRNTNYTAIRKNGAFKLYRNSIIDSLQIDEVVTNRGYERLENGTPTQVEDSMIKRYSNSINSVHYFSVLPFGLNDKAVHKRLLKSSTVKGKEYYKIEITFDKNGGGEDFEDVFVYWIGKNDFLIDYLAYEFHTNGGGMRFRKLQEQCVKNGIRFVDYINYKPTTDTYSLEDLDKAFENNQLTKVSEIVLKNILVEIAN